MLFVGRAGLGGNAAGQIFNPISRGHDNANSRGSRAVLQMRRGRRMDRMQGHVRLES